MVRSNADSMMQAMLGCYVLHVPINLIIQGSADQQLVTMIGQSHLPNTPHPLLCGSKLTHQLIMGDCFIRPHAVIESNQFVGHGLTGLATMDHTDWIEKPHKVLLDQCGDIRDRIYGKKFRKV